MKAKALFMIILVMAFGTLGISEAAFEIESELNAFFLDGEPIASGELECIVVNGVTYAPVEALVTGLGYGYSEADGAINLSSDAVELDPYFQNLIGTWLLGDGSGTYMVFNADGTGTSGGTEAGVLTIYFDWIAEGTNVTLMYSFNGMDMTTVYEYIYNEADEEVLRYRENHDRQFFRTDDPGKAEGAEIDIIDTWHASLTDADCTLSVNKDGSSKLAVGTTVYSLTWRFDGTTLILDQNGVELPAAYDAAADTLTLNLGGIDLVFSR